MTEPMTEPMTTPMTDDEIRQNPIYKDWQARLDAALTVWSRSDSHDDEIRAIVAEKPALLAAIRGGRKEIMNTETNDGAGSSCSIHDLFADIVAAHGEESRGIEDFYVVDDKTIGCRYGDCSIHLLGDGWHYGSNTPAHRSPLAAFNHRDLDYHISANVKCGGAPDRSHFIRNGQSGSSLVAVMEPCGGHSSTILSSLICCLTLFSIRLPYDPERPCLSGMITGGVVFWIFIFFG